MLKHLVCILLFVSFAFTETIQPLPSLREQAEIQQEWLKLRLERVLPGLLRKYDINTWLVICREYNEDPAFFSLVSPTVFAARRRTIYVFHDRGPNKGLERLALGGGSNGGLYEVHRDPSVENRELWGQGQWVLLRKLLEEKNPQSIAINVSRTHAFSDGLSAAEKQALEEAVGEGWTSRFRQAELLPLEYIATRLPEMEPVYKQMMQTVHSLISRAFSNEVITPGQTTSQDVVWWLRQEVNRMGLDVWFHPSVRVQRKGATGVRILEEAKAVVIERGDVLHTDFGITALRLNTDTQHMGYVLKEGESDAPEGIRNALSNSNRLQDLLLERLRTGKTGNQVLKETLEAMKAAGIKGTVYTHPIGDHGHGAGPLVGLWDRQENIPGRGDVPVWNQTWFSIELATETQIPEWDNQELWVGQEEEAMIKDEKAVWVLPRQTKFHLVR